MDIRSFFQSKTPSKKNENEIEPKKETKINEKKHNTKEEHTTTTSEYFESMDKKASSKTKSRIKKIASSDEDDDLEVIENNKKSNDDAHGKENLHKNSKKSTKSEEKPVKTKEKAEKAPKEKPEKLTDSATKKKANPYYAAYMRREGPKNPGSKELPVGKANCLEGKKFLITGVLDSLERDECKDLVVKYGGSVVTTVTKKLDYLIVGNDAGTSKIDKAKEMNVKQINEDELFEIISRTLPKSDKVKKEKSFEENEAMDVEMTSYSAEKKKRKSKDDSFEKKELTNSAEKKKKEAATKLDFESMDTDEKKDVKPKIKTSPAKPHTDKPKASPIKSSNDKLKASPAKPSTVKSSPIKKEQSNESKETLLWVDKYKPTTTSKIIGQQGDKSNAKKLKHWLENWHKFHVGADKQPKGWNREDGLNFKAALLSGGPGIGKTTTATIVCQELGYSFVEMNASDSRSKRLLDMVLGGSVDNCSLENFGHGKQALSTNKHCIIMDEVDGMAGNEDRGGVNE